MRTIILIWILALIYCLLVPKPAHAGTDFSKASSSISFIDFAFKHPIGIHERKLRDDILKELTRIERQIEEAKKASQRGMSKEDVERIYLQAKKVLEGAMVVCSSEIIK